MLAFGLFLLALTVGIGQAIDAGKPGRCGECRKPIRVGDPVIFAGENEWVHEECEPMPDACPLGGTHTYSGSECSKCGWGRA